MPDRITSVLQAPTGVGKTELGGALATSHVRPSERAMIRLDMSVVQEKKHTCPSHRRGPPVRRLRRGAGQGSHGGAQPDRLSGVSMLE